MTQNTTKAQPIISMLHGAQILNNQYNNYKEPNEAGEDQTADIKQILASAVTVRSELIQGVFEAKVWDGEREKGCYA